MKKALFTIAVFMLIVSVGYGKEELQTLTGTFHRLPKVPCYIKLDGSVGNTDEVELEGGILKDTNDGSRVLVRGKIKTRYYEAGLNSAAPSDWHVYMDVKEIRVINSDSPVSSIIAKQSQPLSLAKIYSLKLKLNGDVKKHWWTFKLGEKEFGTLEKMKKFIKSLPKGSRIEWAPGCLHNVDEPLYSETEKESFKKFCEDNGITLVIIPAG